MDEKGALTDVQAYPDADDVSQINVLIICFLLWYEPRHEKTCFSYM